ncbi:MAG TPA: hypothetical protein VNE62_07670 [Actinomycetota bacterium]|nr:hypothetical protein [Actinomycetota bacterium]
MRGWLIWGLRAVLILDVAWLAAVYGRYLRLNRAAQFRPRPSTAQGLAGTFTPSVSLLVAAPRGVVGPWPGRLEYPQLEIVVSAPEGVEVRGAPPGAAVVRARSASRSSLLVAASQVATGEILVVLPPSFACARGFVKRLVAPFVDPWVGATVARTAAGRRGGGLLSAADDVDRLALAAAQVGGHVIGGPVVADFEPFAVRSRLIPEVGGWDLAQDVPGLDLVLRVYARGFLVAYVEQAVALASPATWHALSTRTRARVAGRRRAWRVLRKPLRKGKVLEGPEKTDIRWLTRGATAPFWLLAGWIGTGVLRLADTSWAPEALSGLLLLMTLATPVLLVPFVAYTTGSLQWGRWRMLALTPWLPFLALGAMWTGSGASLSLLLPAGGRRRASRARPEAVVRVDRPAQAAAVKQPAPVAAATAATAAGAAAVAEPPAPPRVRPRPPVAPTAEPEEPETDIETQVPGPSKRLSPEPEELEPEEVEELEDLGPAEEPDIEEPDIEEVEELEDLGPEIEEPDTEEIEEIEEPKRLEPIAIKAPDIEEPEELEPVPAEDLDVDGGEVISEPAEEMVAAGSGVPEVTEPATWAPVTEEEDQDEEFDPADVTAGSPRWAARDDPDDLESLGEVEAAAPGAVGPAGGLPPVAEDAQATDEQDTDEEGGQPEWLADLQDVEWVQEWPDEDRGEEDAADVQVTEAAAGPAAEAASALPDDSPSEVWWTAPEQAQADDVVTQPPAVVEDLAGEDPEPGAEDASDWWTRPLPAWDSEPADDLEEPRETGDEQRERQDTDQDESAVHEREDPDPFWASDESEGTRPAGEGPGHGPEKEVPVAASAPAGTETGEGEAEVEVEDAVASEDEVDGEDEVPDEVSEAEAQPPVSKKRRFGWFGRGRRRDRQQPAATEVPSAPEDIAVVVDEDVPMAPDEDAARPAASAEEPFEDGPPLLDDSEWEFLSEEDDVFAEDPGLPAEAEDDEPQDDEPQEDEELESAEPSEPDGGEREKAERSRERQEPSGRSDERSPAEPTGRKKERRGRRGAALDFDRIWERR